MAEENFVDLMDLINDEDDVNEYLDTVAISDFINDVKKTVKKAIKKYKDDIYSKYILDDRNKEKI